ncbi:hypothetical protein [Acinetobacter bereziniae]|nr:hypothetical protein [Acinetobacter bereziniae]
MGRILEHSWNIGGNRLLLYSAVDILKNIHFRCVKDEADR